MKCPMFSPPGLAGLFIAVALATLTLGPFMHETDQAWLLDGGRAIAQGHPEIARAEFNFDKQFVSYYLPAALLWFFPASASADTLVLAGNIYGMVLFWGALVWLLARSSRRLPLALVLPVLLAPTFLVHSPFFASAFTSAAIVFLLAGFLDRRTWSWPLHWVSFALAFLAVGARADAIFLLPLLAMLHSPQRTFVSVLKSPNTWLMAAGGLAAVIFGRALYLDDAIDFAPHAFRLKQYLGFAAFGLGGAGLLLLAGLHAIWLVRQANRCRLWTLFLGLGLAMPMGYYSFQLLTPRHCTVGVLSIAIFICATRGRAIFENYFRARTFGAAVKFILLLSAIVPVFVGVNLADVRRPRPTLTQPTLLPSGAGVCPTGAYLAHAWHVRAEQGFIDHNHAIWAAAKTTRFQPDATGKVPFLFAPIESYLIFAIRLQGLVPQHYSLADGECPPWFYIESRSLMRFQYTWPPAKVAMENFLAHTSFAPVSEVNWHGITMLRGTTNATANHDPLNGALWALNTVFQNDEFRLEPAESLKKIPADWVGKKIIIATPDEIQFSLERRATLPPAVSDHFGAWQLYELGPLNAGELIPFQRHTTNEIFIGVSVFPAWMSLQKL